MFNKNGEIITTEPVNTSPVYLSIKNKGYSKTGGTKILSSNPRENELENNLDQVTLLDFFRIFLECF